MISLTLKSGSAFSILKENIYRFVASASGSGSTVYYFSAFANEIQAEVSESTSNIVSQGGFYFITATTSSGVQYLNPNYIVTLEDNGSGTNILFGKNQGNQIQLSATEAIEDLNQSISWSKDGKKVFKALLTQSGSTTPTTQTSGSLVVGTTYEITDYIEGVAYDPIIVNAGTGYTTATGVATTGGTGTGITVDFIASGGAVTDVTIVDRGTGYTTGDVITIDTDDQNATFTITAVSDDFTNVGAPSNATGVFFIATGTTPAVWTESSELTYDTAAPTAVVLENTIGNVWFTFVADGIYRINSDGLFSVNKTIVYNNQGELSDLINNTYVSSSFNNNPNFVSISSGTVYDANSNGLIGLVGLSIEIHQ